MPSGAIGNEFAERQFVEAARLHGRLTNENPGANHAAYDKVVASRKELRALPDQGQFFLVACLADSDPSVVAWAAFYLLPTRTAEAVAALTRVATGQDLVAFDAEMTLEEWRAGRLKVE
ncbi:MAG TPA: hypothetical protein VGF50_01725 [Caulobacteraceae bacterium]|jgi:hypothetical protein